MTDDVKKEKDKEPEKAEKQEMVGVLRKKGFEEERRDSDDSDEVRTPLSGKTRLDMIYLDI